MNPNTPLDPNAMSLPQPQYGNTVASPAIAQQQINNQEVPSQGGPVLNPVAAPLQPAQPVAAGVPAAAARAHPTEMTDAAWAQKAKEIIARTQNDPFTLTEELYALRTEFMQQMHGRELKQREDK